MVAIKTVVISSHGNMDRGLAQGQRERDKENWLDNKRVEQYQLQKIYLTTATVWMEK